MKEALYRKFTREEWQKLEKITLPNLSIEELARIESLNDSLSLQDVSEVYLPLIKLLEIHITEFQTKNNQLNRFFGQLDKPAPFIIGIAGSVSVGKSTIARLLQVLLSYSLPKLNVDLVTTDGFLFPNKVLKAEKMMDRKGFPESYDGKRIIRFLSELKSGQKQIKVPIYSHLSYDVLEEKKQTLIEPDIVIVEGVNVLQGNLKQPFFTTDFFDFSIYMDAEKALIQKWYVERFMMLRETAFQDPESYFHMYAEKTDEEAHAIANDVWHTINEINLERHIQPTRNRAKLILQKGVDHKIEFIKLRK
ncbi:MULTISPECIES: type I pantothenate kinase [Brochothrix]|uniref:Pantothenate kinase n=1 Tax=Brochothrix thermosphacta TaxID=2756 RepID=A0A1D2KVT5_BROTH|nr:MULTISPECIES: type I pantothenate kinase [Brochothrix]SLM90238.1 Pantothenate kinase [Brachybacterium faecium]ANZ96996.1 type I pantothenate kinase [Brochothrix thermosphacta]ATF26423.1 type I pantothenate kinase [Brochothrix thermosphacta]ATH85763.1 type I pantothenate kinase [Brochothrix thermosphacta]EUJ37580.1 pantothenate kinase [Brochothrix thermosphacta DSM 20171 = FSL F6-1036]